MRGKDKRGQAAFEYMLTAAVVGIMILPAAYLFLKYSQSSADQIDKAQLDKLGRDIVATAERVYFQGPPSRTELEARLPKNVLNVSIIGKWNTGTQELVMLAGGANGVAEFPYPSKVNINGSFSGGLFNITTSAGIKNIEIEAYETEPGSGGGTTSFVLINFGGRCPRSSVYDLNKDGAVDMGDILFLEFCKANILGFPGFRPTKTWKSGWFDGSLCMNADYDGDCDVDTDDMTLLNNCIGGGGC